MQSKRILNFGSLNIDHVYKLEHFVRPGETIASQSYSRFAGGKGTNQSLALARAGARVFHAGKIGADGLWLKQLLTDNGVNAELVEVVEGPSGHAIIQVNRQGENAIVLHGGANQKTTREDARNVIANFSPQEFLLIQNETSAIPELMESAARRGMTIVFNPAPMLPQVLKYPLALVNYFILNEVEGAELTGKHKSKEILETMQSNYPKAAIVLTLGKKGASFIGQGEIISVPAVKVKTVDTTAAGDTFIGYFLAGVLAGKKVEDAMKTACQAAAICVTRPGAADSIPWRKELSG